MSIQHYPGQFIPTSPLVDKNGVPLVGYGKSFFLAIFNRSGMGNGIVPVVSDPLIATGASIADALQLVKDWNDVETVGTGTGVAIAAALKLQPGNDIWVFNGGANALAVYPSDPTVQIDALGAGTPYSLAAGKLRCFQCWSLTQFRSYGN